MVIAFMSVNIFTFYMCYISASWFSSNDIAECLSTSKMVYKLDSQQLWWITSNILRYRPWITRYDVMLWSYVY